MRQGEKNTFQTNHDSRKNFTLAKILVRHPTVGNLDATGGGVFFTLKMLLAIKSMWSIVDNDIK